MLEQYCKEIVENTRYPILKPEELDRIYTLIAHDIAMAAKAGGRLASDLIEDETDMIGNRGYTLWGRAEKCLSFDLAVEYNAMAVTASIREDFVAGTHPGAILFPLLYAESEKGKHPLTDLISAAAIGLKIAQLLNRHLGTYLARYGFRPTTIVGSIAAAGALSWLKNKSADCALRAMAAAASAANGFSFPFQEGTEEWLLQVPLSAHAAAAACRNSRAIHFHHQNFLTGAHSLGKLIGYAANESISLEEATDLMNIGVKRHPVNSFVQPVLEALLRIDEVKPEEVKTVTVFVPQSFAGMQPALSGTGPFDMPNKSLFSIPVSGAIAMINKGISFRDLQMANRSDVQSLAGKFSIEFTSSLERYDVRVEIDTGNDRFSSHVETASFYPTLKEELRWIREQHGETVPWVESFLTEWK